MNKAIKQPVTEKYLNVEMIRGFIFDMDGTLIETTEIDYNAWVNLFNDYNSDFMPYNEYYKILGVKSTDVIREYLKLEDNELNEALKRRLHYIQELIEENGVKLVQHAEECLAEVRSQNFRIALATGARREKLDVIFRKTPLEKYFDAIVTGDDVENGKPHPEVFLKAAKLLEVPAEQAVVIEDAKNGVIAAKHANMHCIAITTTTPVDELSHADMIISNFQQLLEKLRLKN